MYFGNYSKLTMVWLVYECGNHHTVLYKLRNWLPAASAVNTNIIDSNSKSPSYGMLGNGICLGANGSSYPSVDRLAPVLGLKLHFTYSLLLGTGAAGGAGGDTRVLRCKRRLPGGIITKESSSGAKYGVEVYKQVNKLMSKSNN